MKEFFAILAAAVVIAAVFGIAQCHRHDNERDKANERELRKIERGP